MRRWTRASTCSLPDCTGRFLSSYTTWEDFYSPTHLHEIFASPKSHVELIRIEYSQQKWHCWSVRAYLRMPKIVKPIWLVSPTRPISQGHYLNQLDASIRISSFCILTVGWATCTRLLGFQSLSNLAAHRRVFYQSLLDFWPSLGSWWCCRQLIVGPAVRAQSYLRSPLSNLEASLF